MRTLRFVHRWLGLLLALPLVVQGLTGAVLTLEPALPSWGTGAAGVPASADAVLAAAMGASPEGVRLSRYTVPDRGGEPVTVQFAPAGQPRGPGLVVAVDRLTARALGPADPAAGVMDWIKRLHTNLLVPELGGRQIAGWCGVGLLLLTLLGLPLWWPSRAQRAAGRWREGFTVPRDTRGVRLQRRLHGALGIWLWVMMLATSATGIIQGFPQTSGALLGLPAGGPPRGGAGGRTGLQAPFPAPDLDAAIRVADAAAPGTRLRMVLFPPGPEPMRLVMGPPGSEGVSTATTVLMERAGSKLVSVQSPEQAPAAETALRWAHDLHFGQGFGPVWRVMTVLVGVGLPGFGRTGVALWVLKRRNRARIAFTREAALQPGAEWRLRMIRCLLAFLVLISTPALAQSVAPLPQDLSAWGMIANADWVVKAVIGGLALASVMTWTVALAKSLELAAAGRRGRAGLAVLQAARSLEEAGASLGAARGDTAVMLAAARDEVAASAGAMPREGIKERAAWRLERLVAGAGRRMGRGIGVLATIGATAPFVGLFGTVWGIMNAFIGISRSQTTNLAVVAPGIAEALLATAVGLIAAIPAVVIYNVFARAIAGQKGLLADTVAETMRLLSRDLDRAPQSRLRAVGA